MNRVKFLLVAALAVMAFNGTGCDGNLSSVSKTADMTPNVDSPDGDIDGEPNPSGEEPPLQDDRAYNGIYDTTLAGTSWKLVDVWIGKYSDTESSEIIIDYSEKNIVYEFQDNNKLVVSGKIDSLVVFDRFKEGEHFYHYAKPNVCPLCTPGHNFSVDYKDGEQGGSYYATAIGEKLEIVGDTYVGYVADEDGLKTGGIYYRWGKTFTKLKL